MPASIQQESLRKNLEAVYVDQHYGLVVECKNGSRKAQYDLYKLYSKAMYNISLRILNHQDEAADVLQEAFIDAFARIGEFRQESTFGLWLKQIVINRSISALRKRKVDLVNIDDVDVEGMVDCETEKNEDELKYQVEQVRKAMQELPDGYRVVLSLYLLEGYDHEEISHILKINEATSRTQFMRAKRKLVDVLKAKGINYN